MVTFYCLKACRKCPEFMDGTFDAGVAKAERDDSTWRIVALDTSEKLQDYIERVKPTLSVSSRLPVWYDESHRRQYL